MALSSSYVCRFHNIGLCMDPGSWANECVVLLDGWRSGVAKKTGSVVWSCGAAE